jgi:hypothetical protein
LFENHSENSLKPDLSNDTTANPPLFSLVNTFKKETTHCSGRIQRSLVLLLKLLLEQ